MRARWRLVGLISLAACSSSGTATISGVVVVEGSARRPPQVGLMYGLDDGSGESSEIPVEVADDGSFTTQEDQRMYHLSAPFLDCGGGLEVDATEGDVTDLVLRCRNNTP